MNNILRGADRGDERSLMAAIVLFTINRRNVDVTKVADLFKLKEKEIQPTNYRQKLIDLANYFQISSKVREEGLEVYIATETKD